MLLTLAVSIVAFLLGMLLVTEVIRLHGFKSQLRKPKMLIVFTISPCAPKIFLLFQLQSTQGLITKQIAAFVQYDQLAHRAWTSGSNQ